MGRSIAYLTQTLHVHSSYDIDSPLQIPGDTFSLTQNQTFFTNVVWKWSKNIQIGNQVDNRKTNYRSPVLDATGSIFYSEFQWKF